MLKISKKIIFNLLSSLFMINNNAYTLGQEQKIIVNSNNGHKYIVTPILSWESTQKLAKQMGGNLVTINDEKENQWLVENLLESDTDFVWIGINDLEKEGNFVWISGEKSDYFNWANGEPNNNPKQGGEHFGVLNGYNNPFDRPVGTWSDAPTHAKLRGIIEIPTSNE